MTLGCVRQIQYIFCCDCCKWFFLQAIVVIVVVVTNIIVFVVAGGIIFAGSGVGGEDHIFSKFKLSLRVFRIRLPLPYQCSPGENGISVDTSYHRLVTGCPWWHRSIRCKTAYSRSQISKWPTSTSLDPTTNSIHEATPILGICEHTPHSCRDPSLTFLDSPSPISSKQCPTSLSRSILPSLQQQSHPPYLLPSFSPSSTPLVS